LDAVSQEELASMLPRSAAERRDNADRADDEEQRGAEIGAVGIAAKALFAAGFHRGDDSTSGPREGSRPVEPIEIEGNRCERTGERHNHCGESELFETNELLEIFRVGHMGWFLLGGEEWRINLTTQPFLVNAWGRMSVSTRTSGLERSDT
jgi:hypothetical protein